MTPMISAYYYSCPYIILSLWVLSGLNGFQGTEQKKNGRLPPLRLGYQTPWCSYCYLFSHSLLQPLLWGKQPDVLQKTPRRSSCGKEVMTLANRYKGQESCQQCAWAWPRILPQLRCEITLACERPSDGGVCAHIPDLQKPWDNEYLPVLFTMFRGKLLRSNG